MSHEHPSLFDSEYEILFALDFSFYIVYTVIDISLRFVFQLPINCFLQRDAFIYIFLISNYLRRRNLISADKIYV